jgi:hypothetical protein
MSDSVMWKKGASARCTLFVYIIFLLPPLADIRNSLEKVEAALREKVLKIRDIVFLSSLSTLQHPNNICTASHADATRKHTTVLCLL